MTDFAVGDKVVVKSPHTYKGRSYGHESREGSIGLVTDVSLSTVGVVWESHPPNHRRATGGSSNIDKDCLELLRGEEDALDAEAARLFGLTPPKPGKPANHCPTCTCEEA